MTAGQAGGEELPGAATSFLNIVKSGKSFSGRERHCLFLNLHDETFADASSASGLDWPDDGRGAATVDWDFDGDLDLVVSNRNGPQLRILRNEFPEPGGFLTLALVGNTFNRDAVGARLELFLKARAVPMLRTLRAGDGFLSQSSKTIHFGVGNAKAIDRLVVHWPGGIAETIQNLQIGDHHRIVQGSGRAEVRRPPADGGKLKPAPLIRLPSTQPARVLTHAPIPLPDLHYTPFNGDKGDKQIPMVAGRPVLVNLWASWCVPCLAELKSFAEQATAIQKFGLDVLALSVDAETSAGDTAKAERFLESCNWPFRFGAISSESISRFQRIHNFVLDLHTPLPVPTSFLIDGSGNLQGIFKGPVEVKWLLQNVGQLTQLPISGKGRGKATLPFAGRWLTDPRRLNYIPLAIDIAANEPLEIALDYFTRNRQVFLQSPRAPRLLFILGTKLEEQRRFGEAAKFYRQALAPDSSYLDALSHLARLLAARPEQFPASRAEAVAVAEKAAQLTGFQNPGVLDSLAAAHANRGGFADAVKYAESALRLAKEDENASGQESLIAVLEHQIQCYKAEKLPVPRDFKNGVAPPAQLQNY